MRSPLHLCLPDICPFVFFRTQKLLFPRSAVPAQFLAHIFSDFTAFLPEHKSLSFVPAVACNHFSFCSSSSPPPSASLGLFPSLSSCRDESSSPPLGLPENWLLFSREEQERRARATSCFCGLGTLHVGEGLLIIQPGWAPNCQFLWKKNIYIFEVSVWRLCHWITGGCVLLAPQPLLTALSVVWTLDVLFLFLHQHLELEIFLKGLFLSEFSGRLINAMSTCRSKEKWNSPDTDLGLWGDGISLVCFEGAFGFQGLLGG